MARARTTTPTASKDARARRSIDALEAALLLLIEDKPLDQISIKEITEAAALSYPTFFRRFAGKDELLEVIATREVGKLLAFGMGEARGSEGSRDAIRRMCDYIQDHRRLWQTLLTGGARSVMRDEFVRIASAIADERPRTNPWLPLDLATAFVASGIFEILTWWMRQRTDYPVENVAKLMHALVIDVAAHRHNITLV